MYKVVNIVNFVYYGKTRMDHPSYCCHTLRFSMEGCLFSLFNILQTVLDGKVNDLVTENNVLKYKLAELQVLLRILFLYVENGVTELIR